MMTMMASVCLEQCPPRALLKYLHFLHPSHLRRASTGAVGKLDNAFSVQPLAEVVEARRGEAQRSLLVEVAGAASARELHKACSQYGVVEAMFHHTLHPPSPTSPRATREMILVELNSPSAVSKALEDASFPLPGPKLSSGPPSQSPFVWLAGGARAGRGEGMGGNFAEDGLIVSRNLTSEELTVQMSQCGEMSEQIQMLYDSQKLTELGWRLRFFTCRQIEAALSGLFPHAAVLPFGSSVNSFGHRDSDLDMTLELAGVRGQNSRGSQQLVYQAKRSASVANSRLALQRQMEIVADILDTFLPGCSKIRRILNARVPIIKYRQELTGIECDLTMSNRSGYHMSEMLHLYGRCDARVAPLVCAVRRWARSHGVTSPQAGRWLTNFSLTLLVLHYLMNTSPSLLIPLQHLGITSGTDEETGDSMFVFPEGTINAATAQNEESLESLFHGFFEFYDRFNFRDRGLSIISGRDFVKPEHSALYIQNPLDRELNVSRNVTLEEVERLRSEVTNARFLLEDGHQPTACEGGVEGCPPWGLLRLIGSRTGNQRSGMFSGAINWTDVFSPQQDKSHSAKKERPVGGGAGKSSFNFNPTPELNGLVSRLKQKAQRKTAAIYINNGHRKGKSRR